MFDKSTNCRLAGLLLALAIGLCQSSWAKATDLYVNNIGGDDLHNGLAAESNTLEHGPVRSIQRALLIAHKGDRIIVANTGEPYRESVTIQGGRNSGLFRQPFVIIGNGAVLDGSMPIDRDVWKPVAVDLYRFTPELKSTLIYIDGRPAKRVAVDDSGKRPELAPLEWCLFDGDIFFRGEDNRLPEDYSLSQTGRPVGITIYEARNLVVENLVVQGYRLDGVNAHDGAMNVELTGLTCRGNGRSGISIGGASRLIVTACLVGNNGRAQLRTEGRCRARLVNCDLIDDDPQAPGLVNTGGEVKIENNEPPPQP
jgi:hypothetical protein